MNPTHELWINGRHVLNLHSPSNTVLRTDNLYFVAGFSKEYLESIGYELKEIVTTLENE